MYLGLATKRIKMIYAGTNNTPIIDICHKEGRFARKSSKETSKVTHIIDEMSISLMK